EIFEASPVRFIRTVFTVRWLLKQLRRIPNRAHGIFDLAAHAPLGIRGRRLPFHQYDLGSILIVNDPNVGKASSAPGADVLRVKGDMHALLARSRRATSSRRCGSTPISR